MDNVTVAAYHESGHIVMSYYYGFSCDSVQLSLSEPDTKTIMDYGQMQGLVAAILRYNEEPHIYAEVSRHYSTEDIFSVSAELGVILAAGGIAERVYFNKQNPEEHNSDIKLSEPDLTRLQTIHSIFNTLRPGFPPDFLQKLLQVWYSVIYERLWPAIEGLAQEILKSPNFSLSRREIEQCVANYKALLFQEMR